MMLSVLKVISWSGLPHHHRQSSFAIVCFSFSLCAPHTKLILEIVGQQMYTQLGLVNSNEPTLVVFNLRNSLTLTPDYLHDFSIR
jgi:hypothetical protein